MLAVKLFVVVVYIPVISLMCPKRDPVCIEIKFLHLR